jgi:hypothetical protein
MARRLLGHRYEAAILNATAISVVLAFFSVLTPEATAQARDVSGVNLPEVVSVNGEDLSLNGAGVRREKAFFDVYVIGLYLQNKTSDAVAAITADQPKRISLTMLRDVSREKFVEAVEKCMVRSAGAEMARLRERIDLLENTLPALKKGNILDFTYVPGSGTLVRGQGQELAIPGKDFADALFAAWLGPNPENVALKRALLGGSQ